MSFVLGAVLAALPACSSTNADTAATSLTFSPTAASERMVVDGPLLLASDETGGLAAVIKGVVVIRGGCLGVIGDASYSASGFFPILWPSVVKWDSGTSAVVLPNRFHVIVGSRIELAGGEVPMSGLENFPEIGPELKAAAMKCVPPPSTVWLANLDGSPTLTTPPDTS